MTKITNLGTVCEIKNGFAFKSKDYKKEGVPLLRISNFNDGEVYLNNKQIYVDKTCLKSRGDFVVTKGDILIALSGATTGKYGIYNFDFPSLLNQRIGVLKSGKSKSLFSRYFYFYLNVLKKDILRNAGGAAQPNISTKKISELKIPLPPLHTQKHIARILDDAAALRDKTQQLLDEYDQLAQSIFLDMFGDPVVNPKKWSINELSCLTNLITDGKHGNCNNEENSGYYFISAKDIRDNKINYTNTREIPKDEFEEVDRRTNLQVGDLVMVNTGATIGKMAIAGDVPETRKTTFQKSVAVIKTKKEILIPKFLQFVFVLRLETFAKKGSGSAIKNLLLSEMRRFKIITPPIELQNQFAEKIALIEQQKALAKQELQESEDLFNCLLQRAFKGELV